MLKLYLYTIIVFTSIDFLWIRYFAGPLYSRFVDSILLENPRIIPIVIFYTFYTLILVWITTQLGGRNRRRKVTVAFLVGIISYATYNLTNYAIIEKWSIHILFPDILWGGVLSATSIYIGYLISEKSNK